MNSLPSLFPLLAAVAGALTVLLLEVFIKQEKRDYLGFVSLAFLAAVAYLAVSSWNRELMYFQGTLSFDNLAIVRTVLFSLAVAFIILLSLKYIGQQDANHGEIFALLLLALAGLMIMTSSSALLGPPSSRRSSSIWENRRAPRSWAFSAWRSSWLVSGSRSRSSPFICGHLMSTQAPRHRCR